MWAAANSGIRRSLNHHDDSDWDSESSGERSTTESIIGNVKTTHQDDTIILGKQVSIRKRRKKKKKRKLEETPEAAVARLSTSYSTAMGAVGALHRLSRQIWKDNSKVICIDEETGDNRDIEGGGEKPAVDKEQTTVPEKSDAMQVDEPPNANLDNGTTNRLEDSFEAIQKVAQSARSSIEQSLLLDPTVMAPILLPSSSKNAVFGAKNAMIENTSREKMASAWLTVWKADDSNSNTISMPMQSSIAKWRKLTSAHKSTVKQIAYLSLVNYGDLLCACTSWSSQDCRGDILDRKPVPTLDALQFFNAIEEINEDSDKSCLLWSESREQTLRLALASYCDASELDPTDPTLFFKMACTARSLGRIVDGEKSMPYYVWRPKSYRSLERLALERGLNSLPRGVPPNRLLSRAWKELEKWDNSPHISEEADSILIEDKEPLKLLIHLPNDSWSSLGDILIRAWKEGASYGRSGSVSHCWSMNCSAPEDYEFGSPLMDIRISPMLCLSNDALAVLCGYLGKNVNRLACTCKSLSSEVQSLLSKIAHNNDAERTASIVKDKPYSENTAISTEAAAEQPTAPDSNTCEGSTMQIDIGAASAVAPQKKLSPKMKRSNSNSPRPIIPGERVSKRVRSQMLTSEKETERQAKRSSVDYCFLSGTLLCIPQNPNYAKLLKSDVIWEELPVLKSCLGRLTTPGVSNNTLTKNKSSTPTTVETKSSIGLFVERVSKNNSGPRHLLELFLVHSAMHPADVFGNSKKDPTSCILDCFNLLTTGKAEASLDFAWYGKEEVDLANNDVDIIMRTLSVNLLSAELRLKRTEKVSTSIISTLLHFATSLPTNDGNHKRTKVIIELRCRCYWLASQYYLWLSRCTNDALISAQGERLGMDFLHQALKTIEPSGIQIKTPQLQSPKREGLHWLILSVQTLSAYIEEVQSSSVVSRTRNEFRVVCDSAQGDSLSPDDITKLTSIGIELLDWYTSKGSFEELVSDFIVQHQHLFTKNQPVPESTTTTASDWTGQFYWGKKLWNCVPSSKEASFACITSDENETDKSTRPSLIHVLTCSLFASNEHVPSILHLFVQLTLAALQMRERVLVESGDPKMIEIVTDSETEVYAKQLPQDELLIAVADYFLNKMIVLLRTLDLSQASGILNVLVKGFQSLNFSPKSYENLTMIQFHLIQSLSQFIFALRAREEDLGKIASDAQDIYFVALAKVFVCSKENYAHLISSGVDKRSKLWQSQLTRAADFICHTANELAESLSLQPSIVSSGTLVVSPLIKAIEDPTGEASPIVRLSEASLWFWKYASAASEKADVVRVRLLKPIAAVIISLCGSFGASVESNRSIPGSDDEGDNLSDFFNSDHSINGAFLDNDGQKRILRRLNQCVQCVSLVYSASAKVVGYEYAPFMSPSLRHGPFLPLVAIRTLSAVADNLFELYSHDVWDEVYPYGARACGEALDSILVSAYRTVYGISLVGQNQAATEDNTHVPESLDAAARLFRCVKRLYHCNRRGLPARALELIDKTLPPPQETRISSAIYGFLFDGKKETTMSQGMISCVGRHSFPEDSSLGFPEWILESQIETTGRSEADSLRKMVSSELAKGSITHLDSNQTTGEDDGGLSEERELTRSHELALYNKFRVLLDDLSNNPSNIEGWIVLSETCGFKAEIICDRLVS